VRDSNMTCTSKENWRLTVQRFFRADFYQRYLMRLIRIVVNAITLSISIVSFSLPLCTHREARKDGLDLSN